MSPLRRRRRAPTLAGAVLVALALSLAPAPGVAVAATGPDTAVSEAGRSAAPAGAVVGGAALARRGVVVDLPAGVPAPPAPKAAAWLVADAATGDVLAASGAHARLAPASTLKIFTALALLPAIDTARPYTARPEDAAIDGSKVGLVPGSRYTVADLLHGLLMGSGNDCASALAHLAGGTPAATALMDREADHLGALDTVPLTPSGLDARGQVSSAYDLALATRAALRDRRVGAVMRTVRYQFPAGGAALGPERKRFEIQNHDKMLRNYPGASGGKTGYTVAARHAYAGGAARGDRTYIVTMLRAEGRTWPQAAELLDWAFAAGSRARPVGTLVEPGTVRVAATTTTPADGAATGGGAAPAAAVAARGTTGSVLDGVATSSERLLDRAGLPVGRWSWAVLAGLAAAAVAAGLLLRRRARAPGPQHR